MSNEESIRLRAAQQPRQQQYGDNRMQQLLQQQQQQQPYQKRGFDSKKDPKIAYKKPFPLRKILKISLFFVPILLFVLYVVFLPKQYYPVVYSIPDLPSLEGSLSVNSHLLGAEKLFEGKLGSPETIVHQKGHLYTGTDDGKVLHIHNGVIRTVAQFGKQHCDVPAYETQPVCGRPLGMKFDPDGYLVVIEPYSGLYRVNVATGDFQLLLPSGVEVEGRPMKFLNSLDIASDGNIYLTDSSVYDLRDYLLDALDGRPTGRLLRYDPVKNSTEVLLDGLWFPNGVQLSRYEDFILVCETFAARILKYNIKGIRAGHSEVFIENLPGTPDNIKSSASGGFWVPLPHLRFQGIAINFFDILASRPFLRFILSKLYWVFPLESLSPSHGTMIVELNGSGEIVRTLMDLDGKNLRLVTEVEDVVGVLYLGSLRSSYIARIDSSKLE